MNKEQVKKEYVLWGIPKDRNEEVILYTQAKTLDEAKRVKSDLEKKHECTSVRIQTIDFSKDLAEIFRGLV